MLAAGILIGFTVCNNITYRDTSINPKIDSPDLNDDLKIKENGRPGANTIDVEDQNAGILVMVKRVIMQNSGWVAIHEDAGDIPGNILGAQYFEQGIHSGEVYLLRNTLPQNKYYAIIHSDDGDKAFNHEIDTPLIVSGNIISTIFHTLNFEIPIRNESIQ